MKKILFLPLFKMQSGHHQVADAIMDRLKVHTNEITVKKVDLLSYTNDTLEKVITGSYLKWIHYAPKTYNHVYKNFFGPSTKFHSFKWYQHIFLKKAEVLLEEENPDLIICTHGFPSYLLNQLKVKGKCHVPVINVYTDFFINNFWGQEGINIHFLPTQEAKEMLHRKYKTPLQNMIVTGIPVHEEINYNANHRRPNNRPKILIAGGNSGLGGLLKITDGLKQSTQSDYLILCGKNQKLYNEILSWGKDHIKPLPYLSSRLEMNRLYDEVDAIVTKPGGVTVSEALKKGIPIFIHSTLPGQEQINLEYLINKGLVFELEKNYPLEKQLIGTLKDEKRMMRFNQSVCSYQNGIEIQNPNRIVEVIKWILDLQTTSTATYIEKLSFAL